MQLDILAAVKSLKSKNCEGHDRLSQRILIYSTSLWIKPLAVLFKRIYKYNTIPEKWLISKINLMHKKGVKYNIPNYRPISNLCSTSKIFEKLILLRMQKLELKHKIYLTCKPQHGFKRKHSTATTSILLQSLLASALDDGNFAIMASLNLSSTFDVVNVG